jgi:hypothetical protein
LLRDRGGVCAKAEEKDADDATVTILFVVVLVDDNGDVVVIIFAEAIALLAAIEKRVDFDIF